MSLFKQKEKPDIPKDAPKLKGFPLVASTIWREFFNLLKLNLVFLLSCLGIVTIPAGLTAMSRITNMMVRDENFFVWQDFWKAFKNDFKKSLLGGLVFFLVMLITGFSCWFYTQLFLEYGQWFLVIPSALSVVIFLWAYLASLYFHPMNAHVTLTLKQLLVNSFLLVFAAWKRSLLAILALILLWLGVFLLPYSAVFTFIISFPLVNLMVGFAVYPAIEQRAMILTNQTPEKKKDSFLQAASFKGWDDEEETTETDEPKTEE